MFEIYGVYLYGPLAVCVLTAAADLTINQSINAFIHPFIHRCISGICHTKYTTTNIVNTALTKCCDMYALYWEKNNNVRSQYGTTVDTSTHGQFGESLHSLQVP